MITYLIAAYVVGAIIAAGVTGEVRDEMDGIADLAIIFFWPVALPFWIIGKVFKMLYRIGRHFSS